MVATLNGKLYRSMIVASNWIRKSVRHRRCLTCDNEGTVPCKETGMRRKCPGCYGMSTTYPL